MPSVKSSMPCFNLSDSCLIPDFFSLILGLFPSQPPSPNSFFGDLDRFGLEPYWNTSSSSKSSRFLVGDGDRPKKRPRVGEGERFGEVGEGMRCTMRSLKFSSSELARWRRGMSKVGCCVSSMRRKLCSDWDCGKFAWLGRQVEGSKWYCLDSISGAGQRVCRV
jgi:hypothetical protein